MLHAHVLVSYASMERTEVYQTKKLLLSCFCCLIHHFESNRPWQTTTMGGHSSDYRLATKPARSKCATGAFCTAWTSHFYAGFVNGMFLLGGPSRVHCSASSGSADLRNHV